MARLPRSFGSMLLLFLLALGCRPAEVPTAPEASDDFASQLLAAKQREATDPLDASGYLALIDGALASPDDPQALAAALAATEALVWRDVPGLAGNLALVHRSAPLLSATAAHLRRAWARDEGHPLVRGMIASAIHDLALHVGAIEDARRWRQRAGCPAAATLVGPVGFPPLLALEEAPQVPVRGALPATFPGQPPFATDVEPETIYGDACSFDVEETSPLRGERALLVDVERKAEGETFFAVSSASAAKLLAGGKLVVERPFAAGGASVTVLGRAQLPEGRTRLLLRVADNQDGERVALQIWDEHGAPLRTYAPRPGMVADGVPRDAGPVALPAATRETMVLAVAARLALGEARDALQLLEGDLAPSGADTPAVLDLLRLEAIGRSMALPPNQAMERRLTAAQRAAQDCPSCWEARIARAGLEGERKGYGTGTYAALADLELDAADPESLRAMGIMELVYVAQQAAQQGLGDLARQAYDELATRLPGSILVAELDQRLFNRVGAEGVAAACSSGLDRSRSFCLDALLREPDLEAALRELARLRRLRGNPSTMLELELSRLLAHGRREEAMEIYDALPPARRDLAVLGIDLGTDREAEAKARFQRDMLRAGDAPWSYEPLVRWLEIEGDPAPGFDREGAALVAQDRREAFLPGAGTAVLRRVERYDLRPGGLLHYLIYDLRRVGGTTDVAGGTWMGLPGVDGRGATRFMRRRIYKPDGRILDPDPNAGGQQGDTDLAQLESGDYVEALVSGWALPAEHGQLTLDSPDLMPERTSLREATVRLRHPENLELREWHHPLLGEGKVTVENGRREVVWELRDRAPRTLEAGVPALESRVGLSFGTDSYARIARALADRFASLDEEDPYVARWLADQGVKREMPVEERIGMVVAAVGKALRQADPSALGDFVATMGGGSQNETARWILERGTGSRTWVVHRALRAAGI
ncbi:MAG: hypothetical protein KC731_31980, partial [Myxococcales bacterium]|nr:hypothetical protein [Myxococcales bacterium]